jgi:pimeloyl-ACP methyl ester carboxylesterase
MPRSILAYARHRPETVRAVAIGLHDFDRDQREGLALATALGIEVAAHAPVSPRPVSPRFVEGASAHDGKLWFFERDGHVEPTLFGDTLRQVEAFLHDTVERDPDAEEAPLILVGRGQGGTLALVLATTWPELVDVVVAIDAILPRVPGWDLSTGDLAGRRAQLLAVRRPTNELAETARTLRAAGAEVEMATCGEDDLAARLAEVGHAALAPAGTT